jgi:NitT/TauT family transport system substrate-binding protein
MECNWDKCVKVVLQKHGLKQVWRRLRDAFSVRKDEFHECLTLDSRETNGELRDSWNSSFRASVGAFAVTVSVQFVRFVGHKTVRDKELRRTPFPCYKIPGMASNDADQTHPVPALRILLAMGLIAAASALLLNGCGKKAEADTTNNGLTKVRVGYIGLTCEAPIFTAIEKGFFKEEGLDVSLVKCEWANYKDVLALGGFDITHHLVMYFLKPVEQGLDVKFTGGIHRGCLRVQAAINGPIQSIKDLKGKKIGIPGMGTPPFIFANRVLGANGIDPGKDITWLVFPAGELGLAIDKGEVDAVADSEPIGSLLVAQGKVKNVADQAQDAPYKDEYCCAVLANGKFAANNPKATAAATRALLKGAKWVETNPAAAARMAVEKKYLASNPELNTTAISHLRYVPSVSGAEAAVKSAAAEMKRAGMLSATTDVEELAKKAFLHLDGVSDQWLETLTVETVAGGQVPPDQEERLQAELEKTSTESASRLSCCATPKKSSASKTAQQ